MDGVDFQPLLSLAWNLLLIAGSGVIAAILQSRLDDKRVRNASFRQERLPVYAKIRHELDKWADHGDGKSDAPSLAVLEGLVRDLNLLSPSDQLKWTLERYIRIAKKRNGPFPEDDSIGPRRHQILAMSSLVSERDHISEIMRQDIEDLTHPPSWRERRRRRIDNWESYDYIRWILWWFRNRPVVAWLLVLWCASLTALLVELFL